MGSIEAGYQAIGHHELAFIGRDGVDVWCFGHQPTTEDIVERARKRRVPPYTHVVQKIGDVFEVYDLATLRQSKLLATWTIGLPVATHEDADAAIMIALMSV